MSIPELVPFCGFGIGLRPVHYADFLARAARDGRAPVDFVEVISENFMVDGGRPLRVIDEVRAHCEVALHGVSMSIGSADGVDDAYLRRLRALADRVQPLWVSDHVCWTGIDGFNSHDLLPLPYTAEALAVACANVARAQDALGRPLVLENPSSYLAFAGDAMTEWEFLAELCRRSGCHLLLDVNNIHVSATNHGFDAHDYLDGVPWERVRQIHLAGHSSNGAGLLVDTHHAPVPEPVWRLYDAASRRTGAVATMIERDDRIPPLDDLLAELDTARARAAAHRLAA